MDKSSEKTKLMTKDAHGIQKEIHVKVKGQKLGTVTGFKYLGAIVLDKGLKSGGSLQDCASYCSSEKDEADTER